MSVAHDESPAGDSVSGSRAFGALAWLAPFVLVLAMGGCSRGLHRAPSAPSSEADLTQDPHYADYDFTSDGSVVHIGTQPLYQPSGVILETMRHDGVLERRLAAMGVSLRFHAFLQGSHVSWFLEQGLIQAGVGGDIPALTAAAKGAATVVAVTQYGDCSIVARSRQVLSDLRGKRIAYAEGSNAHYALWMALDAAGLTPEDVRLAPMSVDRMPEALHTGAVEAFAAWEPTVSSACEQYPGSVVVFRVAAAGYLYFASDFARDRPEVVREIVAAEVRAIGGLHDDGALLARACEWAEGAAWVLTGAPTGLPTAACAAIAEADMPPDAAGAVIPRAHAGPDGRLRTRFAFLQNHGYRPPTPWEDVRLRFESGPVEQVLADPAGYELAALDYTDPEVGSDGP